MSTPNGPSNGFSFALPPLAINGQTLGGGVHFDLDLGTNLSSLVNQSFAFVNQSNAGNQDFLKGVINTSQGSLSGYLNQAIPAYTNLATMAADNAKASMATAASIASSNASIAASSKPSGGGLCFITTAVCEMDGLPDDCSELKTLREFRDSYMTLTPQRAALVRAYYRIAPEVSRRLKAMPEARRFAVLTMCRSYIDSALAYIQDGEFGHAFRSYCAMVQYVMMEVQ